MSELWNVCRGLEGLLTFSQIRKYYLACSVLLTWVAQMICSWSLNRKFPFLLSISRLDSVAFQAQRFLVMSLMFGFFNCLVCVTWNI